MSEQEKTITAEIVKDPEKETAIQKREEGGIVEENAILPQARNLMYIASGLAQSGMFPDIKTKYQALAVIEYGRELGLPPVISLQTISTVRGKLCIEAKVVKAIMEKHGVKIKIIQKDKKVCRLQFKKKGHDPFEEQFTWEDASNIKDGKGKALTEKDNYLNYPEEMLYNRCLMKGQRVYDPAASLGLYATFEMEDVGVGSFKAAKKFDVAQKNKKEEKENKIAEEKEEEKPKTKKTKTTKKKEEHVKEPEPEKEKTPEPEPESDLEPEEEADVKDAEVVEEDPAQMTEQEMAEHYYNLIKEDIKLRSTSDKKFREEFKSLKDFLHNKQYEKNKNEGKDYRFVDYNEFEHLSLSLGRGKDLKKLWDHWDYVLAEWIAWEKLQKEKAEENPEGNNEVPF